MVRVEFVQAHRLACLSRAVDVQATLLNLILRDLLASNNVDQAKKLASNTSGGCPFSDAKLMNNIILGSAIVLFAATAGAMFFSARRKR